jgi:hypothetical protein
VFHWIAFDQMHDSPAILHQLDRAFDRASRNGCLPVAGRLYEIEDLLGDPGVVDDRIRRAEGMQGEPRKVVRVAIAGADEPNRPVSKLGQYSFE